VPNQKSTYGTEWAMFTLQIHPSLKAKLRELAKSEGRTASGLVRKLISDAVEFAEFAESRRHDSAANR
jgi:predicted transcriptional regulator